MTDKKDTQAFLSQLEQRQYTVVKSRKNHLKIYWRGLMVASAGNTPNGGNRSLANLRAIIARFESTPRYKEEQSCRREGASTRMSSSPRTPQHIPRCGA
jgi:hypothetical protein